MCQNQESATLIKSEIRLIKVNNCLSCNSDKLKKIITFQSKDNRWYSAIKCLSCSLVFASPQPILSPESINEIYSSDYYANYFGSSVDYQDKERIDYYKKCYEKEYSIYSSYLNKKDKRKVLDVGCGDGRFLEIFRNHGWQCLGLEPSDSSRKKALEKGFKIFDTPFLELNEDIGKFDLIFIDNVIEHINNPIPFLKKAFKYLDNNGILVLKTPNSSSLIEKMETTMLYYLPSWFNNGIMKLLKIFFKKGSGRVHRFGNLHPPVHLAIFNDKSITTALTIAGFKETDINNFFISPHHPKWGIPPQKKGVFIELKKYLHKFSNSINRGEFLISISKKEGE